MKKIFTILYTIIFGFIGFILYFITYLIKSVVNKLKSSSNGKIENTTPLNLSDNYKSYEEGIRLCINKNWDDSLICFDNAINNGSYKQNIFENRGMCLQALKYHYDAIIDFNKAISFYPDDCNLYYLRSISYMSIANPELAYLDILKAIELSKLKTDKNKTYNISAMDMGYSSATELYEIHSMSIKVPLERLNSYNIQLENATSEDEYKKIEQNKKKWESLWLSSVKQRQ